MTTRESAWRSVGTGVETRIDYNVTERIVSEVYGSKYQFLSNAALKRITDTNTYYNYYDLDGQYWDTPHSIGYKPLVMPVNMCRKLVRTRAAWMFENAPDIECPPKQIDSSDDMETDGYIPSESQKTSDNEASNREQLLYSLWTDNRFEEKLIDAARDFYIGGTVALKMR